MSKLNVEARKDLKLRALDPRLENVQHFKGSDRKMRRKKNPVTHAVPDNSTKVVKEFDK